MVECFPHSIGHDCPRRVVVSEGQTAQNDCYYYNYNILMLMLITIIIVEES